MSNQLSPLQRLQAPTPKFFQFAFKAGVVVASVAAGLTYYQTEMTQAGLAIPPLLSKAIEVVGWVSAGVASISKFAIRSEA